MEGDHPIIPTTHGYIKGVKRCSIYDDDYFSFERIPYAQPPLGALRFRAPQPIDPWNDVLSCMECRVKPLQQNLVTAKIEGVEDCLYLNVYVKKLQTDKPLPVMIYIYGGAFQNGEATRDSLGPDYFMHENVILVTMNYRLGALGFLSLSDDTLEVPGNAGLKDQLAALRWFKANCTNFNGDPNNITLFGESAGSVSAHYLMLTDQASGLFHKAILMSGTVCNKWGLVPEGDYAFRLAKLNGYTGENLPGQVLDFLLQLDAQKLVGHEIRTEEDRLNDVSFAFAPTVEAYIGDDCIIPKGPAEMLKTTWSNKIPIMIGGTSFEGLLHYPRVKADHKLIEILKVKPNLILPATVRAEKDEEAAHKLGQSIIKLHMQDAELSFDNVFKYLDIISYKGFWLGFYRSLLSRLSYASAATTFLYRFDFDSPTFNLYSLKYCGLATRGVGHADDLSYLFYGKESWKLSQDSDEYKTLRRMVSMWTAFASHSNPNCREILPARWEPITQAEPTKCLNIGAKVEQMELPEAEKLKVWHSL